MIYSKLTAVGGLVTGFLGWILAINAMIMGNEIGAGTILAASALAFGLLLIATMGRGKE